MAEPSDESDGGPAEVPDAVREWLSSVADERGVSEAELLEAMLAGGRDAGGDGDLDRLEAEFRSMVEDVRERVVQVKRETDEKAPADHSHHDLRSTMEQLGREVGALDAQVEQLDDRLEAGFENYEEILTYLTDTTDELSRRLARLASAVLDIRERVGEAARDEARRTALGHLTETANRHGIGAAKCESCGAGVDIGLLVEPRCPHCDESFSALEPKSGFFRTSVLHTGTVPALESAPEASADDALEAMVDEAAEDAGESPDLGEAARAGTEELADTGGPTGQQAGGSGGAADLGAAERAGDTDDEVGAAIGGGSGGPDGAEPTGDPGAETAGTSGSASPGDGPAGADAGQGGGAEAGGPGGAKADGDAELQAIDGIGPAYAERLEEAGIDSVLALAVADPKELSDTIDVPATTVADWVIQADAYTGT